ncbi:E3 ubiquitin-protein ligase TRIM33-like [Littorina saxatilis]|uniref:E3 ubiquitin-protein ligase TRIM33-like n=1 Tax=Littorina saxatilis TaxID=31220 RepID=UPI0038B52CAA
MAAAYPDPDKDGQPDSTSLSTTCLVCEDDYIEPKMLPCAHRLCRKCLVTWLTSSKSAPACPLCQQAIKKKPTRQLAASASDQKANSSLDAILDDLPTDIVLAALVSCTKKLRPPVFCDVCNRRETATDLCLECGDRLCSGCLKYHSAMGATRNHDVKKISTLTPRDLAFSRREMCSIHPDQYLEVYCPSHGQPLCFKCSAADHKSCKPAETVADAAKRQRGIVEAQVGKLNQAIADVKRGEYVYTESVKKCTADLAALIIRLNEALKAREKQLQAQIASTQMPLKQDLQRNGKELEEWKTQAAANKVLVTEMMLSASDVSLLRVSGSLAARAARLTADVTRSLAETRNQRLVLDIDQYDVLRVEELLRDLGTVELTEQKQV